MRRCCSSRSQVAADQQAWAARLRARPWALPPAKQQVQHLSSSLPPQELDMQMSQGREERCGSRRSNMAEHVNEYSL